MQKARLAIRTTRTKTKVAVDHRDLLTSGDRPLEPPEDQAMWQPFADVMGLSPYVCKASFTCGVLRELLASAGLCLGQSHYLGALFLALDATELLGRCAGGFREQPRQAGQRLRAGLEYLQRIDPQPDSLAYSVEAIVDLRNFLGHGAASSKPGMTFTRELIVRLLQLLASALNRFWQANEDAEDRLTKFARAEISPMVTSTEGRVEPVYVRDVQRLLASGVMPGDRLDHEESWRFHFVLVDNRSVPATGSPGPGGSFVLRLEARHTEVEGEAGEDETP
jgi:hypothetical protein